MTRLAIGRAGDSPFLLHAPVVKVNGKEIGQIARGEALVHDVAPGEIEISWANQFYDQWQSLRLRGETGATYVFEVAPINDGSFERQYAANAITVAVMAALAGSSGASSGDFLPKPMPRFAVTQISVWPPSGVERTSPPAQSVASPATSAQSGRCELKGLGAIAMSAERCATHGGTVLPGVHP